MAPMISTVPPPLMEITSSKTWGFWLTPTTVFTTTRPAMRTAKVLAARVLVARMRTRVTRGGSSKTSSPLPVRLNVPSGAGSELSWVTTQLTPAASLISMFAPAGTR